MEFHFDRSDLCARVTLSGRLTFGEKDVFRRVVEDLAENGDGDVVFDLGSMDYIDSAGLGMLLVAREVVAEHGGRTTIANAHGEVGRMLELARFADFFTMG